eukprot:1160764-Pelagomonas_calceolata.AAC.2
MALDRAKGQHQTQASKAGVNKEGHQDLCDAHDDVQDEHHAFEDARIYKMLFLTKSSLFLSFLAGIHTYSERSASQSIKGIDILQIG